MAKRTADDPFFRVYRALRQELLAGEIHPGDQIVVTDVARRLRTSPTPVREALARLVGEQLVEDRRHYGYFAPLPSSFDLIELYEICEMLVVAALRAARRGRPRASDPWQSAHEGPDRFRKQLSSILATSRNARLVLAGQLIVECLAAAMRSDFELFGDRDAQNRSEAISDPSPDMIRTLRLAFRIRRRRAAAVSHAMAAAHRARNRDNIV